MALHPALAGPAMTIPSKTARSTRALRDVTTTGGNVGIALGGGNLLVPLTDLAQGRAHPGLSGS
jgi:hypothetical protein